MGFRINISMKTKTCSKCKITKPITEFCKKKNRKEGLSYWCKDCKKEAKKIYDQLHKKEIEEYRNSHRKESRKYRQSRKEETKTYRKQYYKEHRQEELFYCKKYSQSHKKEINTCNKNRKKTDMNFKIRCNLRTRIWHGLKGDFKSLPTMFLTGCDIEYLMYHLQCKFAKGMSWDNHGNGWHGKKEWHIDHIKPCASFDLSKPEEQRECFHYSNLQPLWAKDNMKKGQNTMNKPCKCKNPKPRIVGNCEICSICHCLIYKIRNTFHKKTSVKPIKKKYNRSKVKRNLEKEMED